MYTLKDGSNTYCYEDSCPEDTFLQEDNGHACGVSCESKTYKTDSKNDICLKTTEKCDKVHEVIKVGSEDYTHCLAKCEESDENYYLVSAENKCISKDQCNAKGNYVYEPFSGDELCLTAADCDTKYKAKAFATIGECKVVTGTEDADFEIKDNVYTCKDSKYLYIVDGQKAKCFSFEDCMKQDTVFEATK